MEKSRNPFWQIQKQILLCKVLRNRNISEDNDIIKQQTVFFIKERGNPYETTMPVKFYHSTSRQLVGPEISAIVLEFFDKCLAEYLMFPEEGYLQKRKNLGEIIKLFNMPPFIPKNKSEKNDTSRVSAKKATKKIGGAQKKIDIASSRGYITKGILRYDHDNVHVLMKTTKHKKHEILVLLKQLLDTLEYQFDNL